MEFSFSFFVADKRLPCFSVLCVFLQVVSVCLSGRRAVLPSWWLPVRWSEALHLPFYLETETIMSAAHFSLLLLFNGLQGGRERRLSSRSSISNSSFSFYYALNWDSLSEWRARAVRLERRQAVSMANRTAETRLLAIYPLLANILRALRLPVDESHCVTVSAIAVVVAMVLANNSLVLCWISSIVSAHQRLLVIRATYWLHSLPIDKMPSLSL